MNYGQLKHKLISLGFAETGDLTEYEDLGYLYDAINQAVDEIALKFPCHSYYSFSIDDDEEDYIYIDMTSAAKGFLMFGDTPVRYEKDGTEMFRRFSDFEIENDFTVVINPRNNAGEYRIYYEKKCTDITKDTPDTFEFEIPLVAHVLIPLLAAYYLWLDDEKEKATTYQNLYDSLLSDIERKKNKPKASVEPNKEWGVV